MGDVRPPGVRQRRHPPEVYRRRRLVVGGALGAVVLILALSVWMGLGLRSAASSIQADASAAQSSIETVKAQLLAGDYAAAAASAEKAQSQVAAAAQAAQSPSVRLAGSLPVVGQAVDDLDNLIGAAQELATASSGIVTVYGNATGKTASGKSLFSGGAVDFATLAETSSAVDSALASIDSAATRLRAVQGTLPGTGAMASARDKALAQTGPIRETLVTMKGVLRQLPAALGEGGRKDYLLVTLNPAELYAGGGAALGAALIRFEDGRLSIPVRGSVSTKLFPGNPRVRWDHVAGLPYYAPNAKAAFAYADLHPDFTISAVELERAWVANGRKPVDGVITLDPVALSAALRVTGPVRSDAYGEVNADNLVQKLLVDAYVDFQNDQSERHALNDQLMNAVFTRLSGGSGAFSLAKALASTAPGHHFRIWVDDPELQKTVVSSGLAGGFPASTGDTLAVFSQNQNGSKVDVFQKRTIDRTVDIAADGSAKVTTTVKATYDVPTDGRTSGERKGYLTTWSFNWYLAYVPAGATDVAIDAPRNDPGDRDDETRYPGEDGRDVVRVGRWTKAGGTTTVTVTYTMPAGSFGGGGDPLSYTLLTMPQPMVNATSASVTVTAPGSAALGPGDTSGWTVTGGAATYRGDLDQVRSTTLQWR